MKRNAKRLAWMMIAVMICTLLKIDTFAVNLKIIFIKDISVSTYVGKTFSLPKTIDATMSNKSVQKVAVDWNPKIISTSMAGTFVFKGTVKGYTRKVTLTLKVNLSPKQTTSDPIASQSTPEPKVEVTATPTPVVEVVNTPKVEDKLASIKDVEVLRAIAYKFVPDNLIGDFDSAITFAEYCNMLKAMLSVYDNKLVPEWEKTVSKAISSNEVMHRDHGMLATYYAACVMGIGQTSNGNWLYLAENSGVNVTSGFDWDFETWFPECSKASPYKKHVSGWSFATSSKYWCLGQTSKVSGKLIFDIDYNNNTFRPRENLTRKEAIQAVLRLYESTFKPTEKVSAKDEKSTEIKMLADKRRAAILDSITNITKSDTFVQGKTYTGTAYYVSNSGSDLNSGTSPDSPFATLSKVKSTPFKRGDAVFFKRGDIWYGEMGTLSGVTYSAYGTGDKPTFSGSVPEKAASPDKWKLYYSDNTGKKIWVYYRELQDCSGIFFNGGTVWANKIMPCFTGKNYVTRDGKSFDEISGLAQDLDFFNNLDLTKIDAFGSGVNGTGLKGAVYLRSDAGNPGQLYENIEFSQEGIGAGPLVINGSDITMDNLKFVFYSSLGVDCRGYWGFVSTITQNCEIGWCGGGITNYTYTPGIEGYAFPNVSGGAIQMAGLRNVAFDNYIHHCASKSLIFAIHDRPSASFIYSDMVMKGNLLEYNAAGLHLANYMEQENPKVLSGFKNIVFEDNYVLYTGYGWIETKTERTDNYRMNLPLSSIEFGGICRNYNEGIYIRNNIFYLSKYTLVDCYMPKENQPIFSGNVYVQNKNGWLAVMRGRMFSITENGEKYMKEELQDSTGKVFVIGD